MNTSRMGLWLILGIIIIIFLAVWWRMAYPTSPTDISIDDGAQSSTSTQMEATSTQGLPHDMKG